MASGVIDVLRGVVLVDSHSQWGEFAFASGEVIEEADVECAGLVDGGVVVVALGKEVLVLVIPAVLHIAGRYVIGEVCGERTAVRDRVGLRLGGRYVHGGYSWDTLTFTPSAGVVALYVESGTGHNGSGEIETYVNGTIGVLVGIPPTSVCGFIYNCVEGYGTTSTTNDG